MSNYYLVWDGKEPDSQLMIAYDYQRAIKYAREHSSYVKDYNGNMLCDYRH
jgi:hypothetical protein